MIGISFFKRLLLFLLWLALLGSVTLSAAEPARVAVLEFELNDLTLAPHTPEEVARTGSIQPLLLAQLGKLGPYQTVNLSKEKTKDEGSFGYLFQHDDEAAALGQWLGADYLVVGRLHKPSFLFAYLMAHVIDTRSGQRLENYVVEVKGQQHRVTQKGVARLAQQIHATLAEHRAASAN